MTWLHPQLKLPLARVNKAYYLLMKNNQIDLKSSQELYCNESVQLLQWALDECCPFSNTTSELCRFASKGGSLDVLKWARDRNSPYEWDETISSVAAFSGHLDAARGGHLDILKWVRSKYPHCPWDGDTCSAASDGGHLEVLKWLRSQDPPCPWDEHTCSEATASKGHPDILKWARSQNPPCEWNSYACIVAAGGGHFDGPSHILEILKWLRSQDAPCECGWTIGPGCAAAAKGHLEVLKWLRLQEPSCRLNQKMYNVAAAFGDVDMLNWIRSQMPRNEWIDQSCAAAASGDPHFHWDCETCSEAAKGGHFKVLKWLRSQNTSCPWDEKTCENAVERGHVKILQWLRTQDPPCPWNKKEYSQLHHYRYRSISISTVMSKLILSLPE
eukprot:gene881-1707_t